MLEFAAYLIGDDGHIVSRVNLLCADENDARMKAAELAVRFDVELWQRDRRIELYPRQPERNGES
jgi:hypothetical protein